MHLRFSSISVQIFPGVILFCILNILQQPIFGQCPDSILSQPVLPNGVKVIIADVGEDDFNFGQKQDLTGKTITLSGDATTDGECWYEGNFVTDGKETAFNYFRLSPVEGEIYPAESSIEDFPFMLATQNEVNSFLNTVFQAYQSGFKPITGEFIGDTYGYESRLIFPGAEDTHITGQKSPDGILITMGTFYDLHTCFTALYDLSALMKNTPVYISPYKEDFYTIDFGQVAEDSMVRNYQFLSPLYNGTGFDRNIADKKVQLSLRITQDTSTDTYILYFEFYDKSKRT